MATVTGPSPEMQVRRPGRRRWLAVIRVVFVLVLAGVAVDVAVSHSTELVGAASYLSHVDPGWLTLAGIAELVSLVSFAALQHRLLRAGGTTVPLAPLFAITMAGNAITNSLPGGTAFATVFAYRQFRRRGADEALATWTLVAVTALAAITLAVLAIAGVAIAGSDGAGTDLIPVIGILVVGPVAAVAILMRPRWMRSLAIPPLRLIRRLIGWPRRSATAVVDRFVAHLEHVTPRQADWLWSLAWAAGNWAADCLCLVLSFYAVDSPVPVHALLLAYGSAQVAANVPITPGGLGVVEGSLAVALVAFGGNTSATVAAVVLYRLFSFWMTLPMGWLAWLGLHVQARRAGIEELALAEVTS